MNATHHQVHYWNIHHMRDRIDRLILASKSWKPADAARGEATIANLERQIERAKANIAAGR